MLTAACAKVHQIFFFCFQMWIDLGVWIDFKDTKYRCRCTVRVRLQSNYLPFLIATCNQAKTGHYLQINVIHTFICGANEIFLLVCLAFSLLANFLEKLMLTSTESCKSECFYSCREPSAGC